MDVKLIIKRLNNTLSKEEETLFLDWYNASEDHRLYFEHIKQNYAKDIDTIDTNRAWIKLERTIESRRKRKPFWTYGIAASVVVLLSFSYYFINNNNTNIENEVLTKQVILGGTDKAILTLDDGSSIDLEKGELFTTDYLESDGEQLVYKSSSLDIKPEIKYNYLTVPFGGQFLVTLSDNTKVWLNSGSKIKYPVTFKEDEPRQVELLNGEAYFDVSPSTNHNGLSFKVLTKGQVIEVLGTEFNVKAYEDETSVYTTLIEGKVAINNNTSRKMLTPNEQAIFNLESNSIETKKYENASNLSAWKDGIFIFENQPLKDIMKTLSRWYNISVTFEDSEKQTIAFSGVLNKSEDITELLSSFEKTDEVAFDIINQSIIIK